MEAETIDLFDLFAKISLDTSEYDSGVKDVTKSGSNLASKLKSGIASAGKIAAAGIGAITTAAGAAVGGLLALEQSTEEYRIAMGRLNTAFESAGYGADAANQAYSEFYGILGDTDRATEASQLLAKLADNEEDLAEWTNIAAGVNGTFGDSLPIESLIEAANETARTGTVVGTLADALNWAGTVGEDEFNAMLASCSSESERNQLIMETLAGTYDEAANAFYRNNEALVESRNNQEKINAALAKVGESVASVKNALLEQFAPAVETVSGKISEFIAGINVEQAINGIQSLIEVFKALSPVLIGATTAVIAYKAASAISGVIDALRVATEGQTIAQAALNAVMNANPFVLVATAVSALIAAIVTLWNTNEDFRTAVEPIWDAIKSVFIGAWEAIKTIWDTVQPYFKAIFDAISTIFAPVAEVLPRFFSAAWDGIVLVFSTVSSFFQNVFDTIAGIFSAVEAVLSGDFEGAWEAIKDVFAGWGEFFSGLWKDITDVFSGAWEWFSEIGDNIVQGIKNGIQSAWRAFTDWIGDLFENSLVGKVLNVLGIHSPSRVFAGIGENMVLGLGKGWEKEYGHIRRDIEKDMDFGTANVDFAASALGAASAGTINGISSAVRSNSTPGQITVNLMLPDGTKFASYLLGPLANYAKANGTPILNPS